MLLTVKQANHYHETLHLVSRIGRLANPQHLPVLKGMRISQAQFLVLDGLLEASAALRMSEVARAAGLSESELTRVVDELAGKGWVERATDPTDGRAKLLKLTATGARLIRRAHEQATAELRAVWSDFSHAEWHRFVGYLQRFEQGLRRVRTRRLGPARPGRPRPSDVVEGAPHA